MKKVLPFFILMLLPIVASAEPQKIGGIYYELDSNTNEAAVTINPYAKYTGSIDIPATVTYNEVDYSVTGIKPFAFENCTGLTSVTIPNSVTSIGYKAFNCCTGLASVAIPNSVASIEEGAFQYCSSLPSVSIPNGVTSIGEYAFACCSSLTSVTIPSSVTSVGGWTFSGCSGLTSIKVDEGNTTYDSRDNCDAIIKTETNELVTGCKNTVIPNSVTSVGGGAFDGCSGLTSITIPNSVTSIGWTAFRGCTSLTSITIPNSVASIGGSAFNNCSSLTSVTIGSGLKTIYSRAFVSCPELSDVYCLAEAVPTMYDINGNSGGTDAFEGSNIESATLHVLTASVDAYKAVEPWKSFQNIVGAEKCATPTIAFQDGELTFTCETDDVEYIYELSYPATLKGSGSKFAVGAACCVSVYASKAGYENSDASTLEFTLGAAGDVCDTNKDGVVDVADIGVIIDRMAGK